MEFSADHDWAIAASGTWTDIPIKDVLGDGFDPGHEEPMQFSRSGGRQAQDGVQVSGTVMVDGSVMPVAGTPTWFRYTDGSQLVRYGGVDGAEVSIAHGGARVLGEGPVYTQIMYSITGSVPGDCIARS